MINAALLVSLAAGLVPVFVAGHGQVDHVVANGVNNKAPNIYYAGAAENKKTVTRVMYHADTPAFVLPSGFSDNSKMSCEGSAKSPAPDVLTVSAGGSLDIYWQGATGELLGQAGTGGLTAYNPWVHAMGPVQDYITSCNGNCASFDSTNAGWTKLAGAGLDMSQSISSGLRNTMENKPEQYYPTSGNGLWAMAKLVEAGSKWTVNIPKNLKSGEYLIRNELSAVHNPKTSDPTSGPQVYIACVQIKVTNGGSVSLPKGTQAKDLYDPNGAFANFDVYSNPTKFSLPGPAVWDGASSGGSSSSSSSSSGSPGSSSGSGSGSSGGGGSPAKNNNNPSQTSKTSKPTSTSTSSPKRCKNRPSRRSSSLTGGAGGGVENFVRFHHRRRSGHDELRLH